MACFAGCYELDSEACSDILIEGFGLAINTMLKISMIKPGTSVAYEKEYVTDNDGKLTILADDFLEGLFIQGTYFKITALNETTPVEFTKDGIDYSCILIHFINVVSE